MGEKYNGKTKVAQEKNKHESPCPDFMVYEPPDQKKADGKDKKPQQKQLYLEERLGQEKGPEKGQPDEAQY